MDERRTQGGADRRPAPEPERGTGRAGGRRRYLRGHRTRTGGRISAPQAHGVGGVSAPRLPVGGGSIPGTLLTGAGEAMCGIVGLLVKNASLRERLGELMVPMLIGMTERG